MNKKDRNEEIADAKAEYSAAPDAEETEEDFDVVPLMDAPEEEEPKTEE